jgi:DNA polymerase III subunit epsilon
MTAPWTSLPLLAIDTETTGISPFEDRVVEVAAVDVLPDGSVTGEWSTIVDPGIEIPEGAAEVHGITTERARAEGVAPAEALAALAERIWQHIDAHRGLAALAMFNGRFDWPLILEESARHHVDMPCFAGILDPYLIDRMADRYRPGKRQLTLVADHYGVDLGDQAHGALADATAAGQVMWQILDRFPAIGKHSLASLWLRQVKGHERDRERFEDWMHRNADPDADIVPGWPIPLRPERPKPQPENETAGAPA